MNALAELRKRASTAAIPAIPAIRGGQRKAASRESQESQESQGMKAETRFSEPPPARLPNTPRAYLLARPISPTETPCVCRLGRMPRCTASITARSPSAITLPLYALSTMNRGNGMKAVMLFCVIATLALSACGGSGTPDYESSASDTTVNNCGELSDVAKFAMQNRQNGVSLDTQVGAAQSAAQVAVVHSVYRLPISTSPSDAWGITQTACLKASQ